MENWRDGLGWQAWRLDIAAGEPGPERSDPNYRDVLPDRRLRQALVIWRDPASR